MLLNLNSLINAEETQCNYPFYFLDLDRQHGEISFKLWSKKDLNDYKNFYIDMINDAINLGWTKQEILDYFEYEKNSMIDSYKNNISGDKIEEKITYHCNEIGNQKFTKELQNTFNCTKLAELEIDSLTGINFFDLKQIISVFPICRNKLSTDNKPLPTIGIINNENNILRNQIQKPKQIPNKFLPKN